MTFPEPRRPADNFITAEDALLDMEMIHLGMRESGEVGHLEGDEARKLATYLFSDDEHGLPDELKKFFDFPEEE